METPVDLGSQCGVCNKPYSTKGKLKRQMGIHHGNPYKPKKCEHGRIKSRCKQCGGSSICEHGRQKSKCKECGGASICEHGRIKSTCKECGGSSICEHGRIKSTCKQCGGSSICEHGRIKSQCKECGGSQICEHGRIKSQCKQCGGANICEHGRQKSTCKECGGSSICEHGRIKSTCKECGGSSICEHGRQKFQCVHCSPQNACTTCHYQYVKKKSRFHPQCARCYYVTHPDVKMSRNFKTKEIHFTQALMEQFPDLDMTFDKQISGGCSRRRPDVVIERLTHVVIVECDENQHSGYSCENKRTMELFQDFGNRPIVIIRFNPDSYRDEGGNRVEGCFATSGKGSLEVRDQEWERRLQTLFDSISHWVENVPTKEITEKHMFYNE